MKKKLYWIYLASIFVLFIAVGFIARQWWVGADENRDALAGINFKNSAVWLEECKAKCSQITVDCSSYEGDTGGYDPDNPCQISIAPDICRANNITTGSYSIDRLKNLTGALEGGKDLGACFLVHEVAHACDKSIKDSKRNQRCTEVGANQAKMACEKAVLNNICQSDPSSPLCVSTCQEMKGRLTVTVWDACMCSASSDVGGVDNSVCCSCINECRNKDYYKDLLPSYCGAMTSQYLEETCSVISSQTSHDCNYYNEGVRDEGKKCATMSGFDPQICSMRAEYFNENKDEAQEIVDNECGNLTNHTSGSVEGPIYLRGIIDVLKPMKCKNCTPEEHANDSWCPADGRCMDQAGYIKFTCVDNGCDQGATSPVKARGISNAINPTSANVGTSTNPPLTGLNLYAQRKNEFYQMGVDAPRIFLGATDESGFIETNLTVGQWKITAQKDGYRTLSQIVTVQRGQLLALNLNMIPDGTQPPPPPVADKTLSVVVRRQGGSVGYDGSNYYANDAINGATVKIIKGSTSFTKTTVAPTGEAIFENLEAGTWTIEVTKPGYATAPTTVNIANPLSQVNIIMTEAQGSLTIRSVDQVNSSTNPLSGVAVTIKQGEVTRTQTTDASGNTTFTNLAAGEWVVTGARANFHQEQPLTQQSASVVVSTTDLIMDSDSKNLTVRLKTTLGTNMANIQVKVDGPTGAITKTTATNGTAVFNGLRIGPKTITVTRSGWTLAANQVMTVNLQENASKDIVMQRAGNFKFSIKGRTLGISVPLRGATVKLCNKPLNDSAKVCREQTTNFAGASTFTDYVPGTYYYEARANNYTTRTGSVTIVKQTTKNLTVQLDKR